MDRRPLPLLCAFLLMGAGPALAEKVITGQITFSGGKPPPITEIRVTVAGECGDAFDYANSFGLYEIRNVNDQQSCTLEVWHGETVPLASTRLLLTGYRTHANFLLRAWPSNQWLITRE